jgi:hypothetical protein
MLSVGCTVDGTSMGDMWRAEAEWCEQDGDLGGVMMIAAVWRVSAYTARCVTVWHIIIAGGRPGDGHLADTTTGIRFAIVVLSSEHDVGVVVTARRCCDITTYYDMP